MADQPALTLAAIVPTYERHEILVDTVRSLLALERAPDEIVIVDQSREHPAGVERQLASWASEGAMRWIRRAKPSIPAAMNAGLLAANSDAVLFLDDDIEPMPGLVAAHLAAHLAVQTRSTEIVAGQVLQPGETPEPLSGDRFAFRSSFPREIREFMAGNVSMRRAFALALGGFDEKFVGAAYRFEADFAARALASNARIRFEPAASIRHLRAPKGGTRIAGSHLTTVRPAHSVGEYYFLLRHRPPRVWRRFFTRPWRSATTRYHLRHPWRIPATLVAELSGLIWAVALAAGGPKLLSGRDVLGDEG